mmetsp:Transcript_29025/g.79655  ORF Transcript_29025/g.79655 Transcript_29025/m.79655 type:complete len:244 (+) Transcript_29025:76-807(+)
MRTFLSLCWIASYASAFLVGDVARKNSAYTTQLLAESSPEDRRSFLEGAALATVLSVAASKPAEAVGPVKIALNPLSYTAAPCPPSRPIPGQMAMKGMRGLCVTVEATLKETSPKDLKDVGVYGFVTDGDTGDSVLANNPDLSTDAGQFAMVESITPSDKKIIFDFVAAVPTEKNIQQYENGIGPLNFDSLRVISYPGGQQYGAISPCEFNEFSAECDAWEEENGPYQRGEYMMKKNPRSGGR